MVEDLDVDETGPEQRGHEHEVLLSARDQLRDHEVVTIEADSPTRRGVDVFVGNHPRQPPVRHYCGRDAHALPIDRVHLMEPGTLTDRTVDGVRLPFVGVVEERKIGFHRHDGFGRQLGLVE